VEDPKGVITSAGGHASGKNSGFHVVLNRNKRSLTLNLKAPEGKDVFKKLAASADVVLEVFARVSWTGWGWVTTLSWLSIRA